MSLITSAAPSERWWLLKRGEQVMEITMGAPVGVGEGLFFHPDGFSFFQAGLNDVKAGHETGVVCFMDAASVEFIGICMTDAGGCGIGMR